MNPSVSDEQVATLSECIFQGRKIEAIKLYRGMTGLGLKEAKDAVEELEKSLRASAPDKFAAGAQGKGCLGVIVVGVLCTAGLVTYWAA
ncbi:MAG TPA: ribosomal protein L7/L12 [Roseimicrobium sp.]|nr:ribosomal protein L7/L12 [Roseimicrobium sp.]